MKLLEWIIRSIMKEIVLVKFILFIQENLKLN